VHPALTAWLEHAQADTLTPYGRAAVSWWRSRSGLQMDIEVPVGSTADVRMPKTTPGDVMESGHALSTLPWVRDAHACGADTCFELASGRYSFYAKSGPH
jgi:alpha-L-rhamnosidase